MSRNKSRSKTLGIVIPVFNGYDYLHKCLEALPEACGKLEYKVYVIDNGSDEKKRMDFWKSHKVDKLQIYDRPLGFPGACNTGAEFAEKDTYLLFLNSDAIMFPGSIEIMVNTMKNNPLIGVVGAKLLFPNNDEMGKPETIQHAGIDFDVYGRAAHSFMGWEADNPKVNLSCQVDAVTGACLLVRKSLFDRVQGFFLGYGAGTFEDVDLCLTVRSMGYIIYYEAKAVGYHHVGASARENKFGYPLSANGGLFDVRWGDVIRKSPWNFWKRF